MLKSRELHSQYLTGQKARTRRSKRLLGSVHSSAKPKPDGAHVIRSDRCARDDCIARVSQPRQPGGVEHAPESPPEHAIRRVLGQVREFCAANRGFGFVDRRRPDSEPPDLNVPPAPAVLRDGDCHICHRCRSLGQRRLACSGRTPGRSGPNCCGRVRPNQPTPPGEALPAGRSSGGREASLVRKGRYW